VCGGRIKSFALEIGVENRGKSLVCVGDECLVAQREEDVISLEQVLRSKEKDARRRERVIMQIVARRKITEQVRCLAYLIFLKSAISMITIKLLIQLLLQHDHA
jgi:hypothetical protein